MICKKIILTLVMALVGLGGAAANTVSITLRVTMPDIVSMEINDDAQEEGESNDDDFDRIVVVENTTRDGQPVIVKSSVTK